MYSYLYNTLEKASEQIEVIIVGLGFMSYGFYSGVQQVPGIKIPLILSRRPDDTVAFLINKGHKAVIEHNPSKIKDNSKNNVISVSDDLDLIKTYENKFVIEMTGTVDHGVEVALKTFEAGKHFITMNPELQATLGSPLKKIADEKKLHISDVYGDQPGSLARLLYHAKMMGFRPLVAGNMKRYRDNYATQEKMQPWADDKGLAVRQTVSFTDGTKQAIEMTLVANYFGFDLMQPGMHGVAADDIRETLLQFSSMDIPDEGIVDYAIGKNLFPGVFVIVEHTSPDQQQYLRYLNMGDGPRYVLFDAYHLCHLEVANTIAQIALTGQEVINNGLTPVTATIAYAKQDISAGTLSDGIGGDLVRGDIVKVEEGKKYVPVGLTKGMEFVKSVSMDEPIPLDAVKLPDTTAVRLWKSYNEESES